MTFQAMHIGFSRKGRHEAPREVLRDLSLTISRGESVGILGREGSGKTTLLNVLGGLVPPDGGSILINGLDPWEHTKEAMSLKQRTGYTFQFPEEQFLRESVEEEFRDILALRGVAPLDIGPLMVESLLAMGIDPAMVSKRSPHSLSLGESRRLSLALVLAARPDAVIADEPTSGLDAAGVACTLQALAGLQTRGATMIIATHDVDLLAEVAGRVLILEGGAIAVDGPAGEVLGNGTLLREYGYRLPEVVSFAIPLLRK